MVCSVKKEVALTQPTVKEEVTSAVVVPADKKGRRRQQNIQGEARRRNKLNDHITVAHNTLVCQQ